MKHTNDTSTAFWIAALVLMFEVCTPASLAQVKDATPVIVEGKSAPPMAKPVPPANLSDPVAILRSAKTIYVRSSSLLVGQAVLETKLRKRSEFQRLGLVITRDPTEADLVLELEHDVLTKYVYTVIHPNTSIVVASGKLSSLGGTVAGKVAKRFMQQMVKARIS